MILLQIELIKLKRLANYILLGLIVLIPVGIVATFFHTINTTHVQYGQLFMVNLETSQSLIINFMLAVFIIMNIGKEYSDNTLRRSIIDGFTRDQFFKSKLLIMLVSVILIYIIAKIILITGGLVSGHSGLVTEYLTPAIYINTFVRLLSVGILSFFLVFLTRSIPISIVAYFIWNIVEGIVVRLGKFGGWWDFDLQNYLPLSSMDTVLNSGEAVKAVTIIIAVAYLLIMLSLSYILLLKRDIK